jgi:hypothetical protein
MGRFQNLDCKIFAIANQKGGTGKTTTASNMGFALAAQGKKVLLFDFDPQSNLSMSFGLERPDEIEMPMHKEVDFDEYGDPIYEERSRIDISLTNNSHNVLMSALGFTPFQRDWAYFLYDNICDAQLMENGYEDYTGGPLINYGDLVFADGGRDVVYYNQTDERWGNEMYGTMHTIAVAGCGPTALAMVVSSMTSTTINPKEMADWSVENGHCCDGNGSYHTLINQGAAHFGLSVKASAWATASKSSTRWRAASSWWPSWGRGISQRPGTLLSCAA